MSENTPQSVWKSAEIEIGKTMSITHNRAVNFRIATKNGTVIDGVVPANEHLTITNGGDLISVDINIYEQPSGPSEVQ